MFDGVVVAVGYNEQKQGWMPVTERVGAIRKVFDGEPRVEVTSYSGLTIDLARQKGISVIVRGIRSMTDFEYEMQLADVNRRLSGIETILLPTSPELASISSSVVRELARYGRDISEFLP